MRQVCISIFIFFFVHGCAILPSSQESISLNKGAVTINVPPEYCVQEEAVSQGARRSFAFFTDCQENPKSAVSISILRSRSISSLTDKGMGKLVDDDLYQAPHSGTLMPFTESKTIYRTGANSGEYVALITYYSQSDNQRAARKALFSFARAFKRSAPTR